MKSDWEANSAPPCIKILHGVFLGQRTIKSYKSEVAMSNKKVIKKYLGGAIVRRLLLEFFSFTAETFLCSKLNSSCRRSSIHIDMHRSPVIQYRSVLAFLQILTGSRVTHDHVGVNANNQQMPEKCSGDQYG